MPDQALQTSGMTRILIGAVVLALVVVVLPPIAADLGGYRANPALVRQDGRIVEIGDGRFLHVVELGGDRAGTPVVLIHGLPGTTTDWTTTPEELAALGHPVFVYDRVGYGFSSREEDPESRHTYASSADDLAALLDVLSLERPILVGWSYGGGVVQQFAVRAPERASGIVLIGSVGPASLPSGHEESGPTRDDEGLGLIDQMLASPIGAGIFDWVGSIPPLADRIAGDALAAAFAEPSAIPPGFVESTRAALELPGTFTAFATEARKNDLSTLHPEAIALPALVIHGTEDRLVPYDVGLDLEAKLPQARLETVFDGSHMLPATHPELVARAIHNLAIGGYILEPEPTERSLE